MADAKTSAIAAALERYRAAELAKDTSGAYVHAPDAFAAGYRAGFEAARERAAGECRPGNPRDNAIRNRIRALTPEGEGSGE